MSETLTPAITDLTGDYRIDTAHTRIGFVARHAMVSKVRGTFKRFEGRAHLDQADPTKSTATVTIDIASIDTGTEQRDAHLRTNDFFAPEQFPTMTFRSTGIRVEGDNVLLDGELTLRGVTKPVTITGEFGGIAKDPWGNLKAAASGSTVINRHDFGVSWNAPLEAGGFLLGDQVTITIDAQFALQA